MRYSKSWRGAKKLTPETLLKRAVRQYLGMTGWFCFPILQGIASYKGIPDIIACRKNSTGAYGQVLFIECKAPKGKQSPDQIEFERRIKEAGCIYLLVRDVTDLMKEFKI